MLSSKHSLSRSGCRRNVSRCALTLCAFLLRALILHLERFRPPPPHPSFGSAALRLRLC